MDENGIELAKAVDQVEQEIAALCRRIYESAARAGSDGEIVSLKNIDAMRALLARHAAALVAWDESCGRLYVVEPN